MGLSPELIAALITQLGIPELMAWLADLRAANKTVTTAEALAKLDMDVDAGNAAGIAAIKAHGG